MAPKKMKCIGINLSKHVQDMYAKNNILMKEIEESLNKLKDRSGMTNQQSKDIAGLPWWRSG